MSMAPQAEASMQCRWARLMLVLGDRVSHHVMSDIFGQLQEKVVWLAERPYLAEGLPFRVLTLLKALLQVLFMSSEVW